MTQIARPQNDDDEPEGQWTPKPVSDALKNGKVVSTTVSSQPKVFQVQLQALSSWPPGETGTLTVGLAKSGTDNVPVTVSLLQGNTVIASQRVQPVDDVTIKVPGPPNGPISD